ncbi:hypothetical protein PsYK624_053780 [Phanerochaete sordida]|uniref:Uncharacterized protein n=1 Tax=Phanerochaete sordida TaxID=48140 RepID=A0A9P3G6T2_9APHY|nr:hypothetical protein PsYK624_053780 [Phanerochaete sordida]
MPRLVGPPWRVLPALSPRSPFVRRLHIPAAATAGSSCVRHAPYSLCSQAAASWELSQIARCKGYSTPTVCGPPCCVGRTQIMHRRSRPRQLFCHFPHRSGASAPRRCVLAGAVVAADIPLASTITASPGHGSRAVSFHSHAQPPRLPWTPRR